MSRTRRRPSSRKAPLRPSPENSSGPPAAARLDVGIGILLVVAIFMAYAQTLHFSFVNYDDPDYVTANSEVRSGLTRHGIVWAFTHSFAGNWFPLTWLSHMIDVELFGLDSGRHHLTSVCIHALAAVLLFVTLRRITASRWPAAMVAALFALHPLHVESVAWIAERKDVLSAFFWILTLYAYARYAARPTPARYAATLIAFCLGLMCKPMLVTLPFVLLLLDYWPLARGVAPCNGVRILEKLPFLALAAATSLVTYVVHQQAGATASLGIFPLALRFENALVSYAVYIVKMLWPGNLAVFYPYPRHSLAVPALFAGLGLLAITVAAMRTAARRPYLIVGWLWYLVTLAPVIGLIQVGAQARADRYTYIPMIGLSIALVWGLAEIVRPWPKVQAGLAWTACVVCVLLTWSQVRYWRDGVSLFRHAVDVTTDNYVARFNLASALDERGESAEAARELAEAVRIRPDFAVARAELGQLLAKQGQFPEALLQLNEARRLNPSDASIHFRLGTVLGAAGRESEAGAEFLESVRLDSGNADAHYNLGIALANQSRISEASNEFAAAVRLRPDDAYFRFNLGVTLARLGQIDEAIAQLSEAVRIDARLPGAREALDDAIALRRARGK